MLRSVCSSFVVQRTLNLLPTLQKYQQQLCSLQKRRPPPASLCRQISTSSLVRSSDSTDSTGDPVKVNYITKSGEKVTLVGREGDNVMHLAQKNSIDIEGACEASLACCTCHVYVREDYYDKLTPATEEEEDLLDMAPFLKSNSRLSCQIILSKDIDDIEVTLPPVTRNFYVDGHKPSHH